MRHPILFEIDTRCWLNELSVEATQRVTLGNIDDKHYEEWQRLGFTHIWLMGVWTSGKQTRRHALHSSELKKEFDQVLPGWKKEDVAGSPYSIVSYQVPRGLGGEAGLKKFRSKLQKFGLKLILDFVPNHLAPDHPWVAEHPERFVQCDTSEAGSFIGGSREFPVRLCQGRDPYFDPWEDTVQLDYRRADTRTAMTAELETVALRCDGVRCDMAMLVLNEVFADTWKDHPCRGDEVSDEFWLNSISSIRKTHPTFLFLAEVYWDREHQLIQQGFDYAYQKQFTDAAIHQPEDVQSIVLKSLDWIDHSAHFLENHDEPRAAAVLEPASHKAAALATLALPGMRFLHEGQLRGWKIKTPVQLGVRQSEKTDPHLAQMYETLITTLSKTSIGNGHGAVLKPSPAWPENDTAHWMLLIQWQSTPDQFHLVVVNFAAHQSQCYAPLAVETLAQHTWKMSDLLSDETYERKGETLQTEGLYLDLPAHGAQCFEFNPVH